MAPTSFVVSQGILKRIFTKRKLEIIFIYIDHKEEMRTEVTFQNHLQSHKNIITRFSLTQQLIPTPAGPSVPQWETDRF